MSRRLQRNLDSFSAAALSIFYISYKKNTKKVRMLFGSFIHILSFRGLLTLVFFPSLPVSSLFAADKKKIHFLILCRGSTLFQFLNPPHSEQYNAITTCIFKYQYKVECRKTEKTRKNLPSILFFPFSSQSVSHFNFFCTRPRR